MNRKEKKKLAFGILIILIAGVVLAYTGKINLPLAIGENYYSCLGGGLNVYSFSKVDYIDYDSLLRTSAWKLSFNPYTGSQCLIGRFDKSTLKDENKEGLYDFSIDVKTSPQTCDYFISRTGQSIRNVNLEHKETWYPWKIDDIEAECNNNAIILGNGKKAVIWKTALGWYDYKPSTSQMLPPVSCYYFSEKEKNNVGNIVFDKLSFSTKIILKSPKGVYEGEITNSDKDNKIPSGKQFWLGDGNEVKAEFEGIMSTGLECPRIGEMRAMAVYDNYKWKIIDEYNFNSYNSYDTSGMWNCLRFADSESDLRNCEERYNTLANSAKAQRILEYKGSQAEISGSKIKFTYDKLNVAYPIIGLRVKADILGVATRGGKPKIINKKTECFKEGYNGYLKFDVENIGNYLGNFYSKTTCPNPISVITQPSMKIPPNSKKTFVVNIRSNPVDKETKRSCVFRVWDDETGEEDSTTITACVDKAKEPCTLGQKRCSPDLKLIEQCFSGGNWNTLVECKEDEICVSNGEPKCVKCIKEGDSIVSGLKCCPGLIKKDNKCIKPTNYCKSCFSWIWNKAKPGYCKPSKYIDKWYLPEFVESQFTQDTLCPIILIFYSVGGLAIVAIVFLIFSIIIKTIKS